MSQLVGFFSAIGIIAVIALIIWIAADSTWTEIKVIITESVKIDIDETLIEAIEEVSDDPDTIWDDPRQLHALLRELILLGAEQRYIELCQNQQELFDHG